LVQGFCFEGTCFEGFCFGGFRFEAGVGGFCRDASRFAPAALGRREGAAFGLPVALL
jgi:hypothetical protein